MAGRQGASTLLANIRAAWTPHALGGFEFSAELLNVFDSRRHDVDYFYPTRFAGEPADGVVEGTFKKTF